MAEKEKELRQMNRTELIEIIYALQQNERGLRSENENLQSRLEDKVLRIEQAGSIAEASLSLNHIFEDAQKAAGQYLESIREKEESLLLDRQALTQEADAQALQILQDAQAQAQEILSEAQAQAQEILAGADARAQETLREAQEAEARIRRMAAAFKKQRRSFLDKANAFLKENPQFAEQMQREQEQTQTEA